MLVNYLNKIHFKKCTNFFFDEIYLARHSAISLTIVPLVLYQKQINNTLKFS